MGMQTGGGAVIAVVAQRYDSTCKRGGSLAASLKARHRAIDTNEDILNVQLTS